MHRIIMSLGHGIIIIQIKKHLHKNNILVFQTNKEIFKSALEKENTYYKIIDETILITNSSAFL